MAEGKRCVDCGEDLERYGQKLTTCPICGFPVIGDILKEKEIRITRAENKVRSKKRTKVFFVFMVILLISYAIWEVALQGWYYENNAESVTQLMISGVEEINECQELIQMVMYNAINKEYDSVTDQYTNPDGEFVLDVSFALDNLFDDIYFENKINDIKENQRHVDTLMERLKNPPKKYSSVSENAIFDLHKAYSRYINNVINPVTDLELFTKFTHSDKIDIATHSESAKAFLARLKYY